MKALLAVAVISLLALAGVARAADPAPATVKPYPLKTCFISGEKLGEMGKPVVFTYEGQEIKLCCKDCKKKFDADPVKYMKDLRDAEKNGTKDSTKMDPGMKM